MFAFNRSALAVLAPLALLLAVVFWSNRSSPEAAAPQASEAVAGRSQTVAANFPSR